MTRDVARVVATLLAVAACSSTEPGTPAAGRDGGVDADVRPQDGDVPDAGAPVDASFEFPVWRDRVGGDEWPPDAFHCVEAPFPEGGVCYACLAERCCVPLTYCGAKTTHFDDDAGVRHSIYDDCLDGPVACVRTCFAENHAPQTRSLEVVWRCTERCVADYVGDASPLDTELVEYHRNTVRALIGCAVGATPSFSDAGVPESCTASCFEGF